MNDRNAEPGSMSPPAPAKAGSGLAITALITGIIGLVICLTAPVAIVCGIVALVKGQSKGLSITGIVTGAIGLVFTPFILAALVFPAVSMVRQMAIEAQDLNNMRQIAMVVRLHASEHNGIAPTWEELSATLAAEAGQKILRSAADRDHPQPYLYIRPAADAPGQQLVLIRNPAIRGQKQRILAAFVDSSARPISAASWPMAQRLAASAMAAGPGVSAVDWQQAGWDERMLDEPSNRNSAGPTVLP